MICSITCLRYVLSLACFNDLTLGSTPPCRWIVNFDVDFMDGLVLAALVSAHVPFVVSNTETSVYLYYLI